MLTAFILAGYFLTAFQQWREVMRDAESTLDYVNRMLHQGTRTTLKGHELILRGLGAELVSLGALDTPERGRALIERMAGIDPGMVAFALSRPDGRIVLLSGVAPGVALPNLRDHPQSRDSFDQVLASEGLWTGRPYFLPALGEWVIPIRVALHDEHGEPIAVMSAGYSIRGGTTAWADMSLPSDVQSALLRDDHWYMFLHPLPTAADHVLQGVYGQPAPDDLVRRIAQAGRQYMFITSGLLPEQSSRLTVIEPIPDLGLTAVSSIPLNSLLKNLDAKLGIPSLFFLIFLAGGYWTYRRSLAYQARAQAKVASLDAWRQALLDSADYGIVSTSPEGRILTFNRAAERMLGYRADEVVEVCTPVRFHDRTQIESRRESLEQAPGAGQTSDFDALVAKARQELPDEQEWTYLRKDGSRFPVRLSITALRTSGGEITGYMGIAADLSRQYHAENSLRDSEARYRALFEGIGDSVFLMQDYRFVDCNPATLDMFQCTRAQILGETPARFSPDLQPNGHASALLARQRITGALQGRVMSFEWQHVTYEGTPFDAEVTLNRVELAGRPHLLATVRDISERKQAEREIAQSRQNLLNSNEHLRLINELSTQLHETRDIESIAEKTINAVMSLTETPNAAFYLMRESGEHLELINSRGLERMLGKLCESPVLRIGSTAPVKGGLNGIALESAKLVTSSDFKADSRMSPQLKQAFNQLGINSGLFIPLIYHGRRLGTIALVYFGNQEFDPLKLETLNALGAAVSLAIANRQNLNQLEYQATHDPLTDLPNRQLLHRGLRERLSESAAAPGVRALLLLDIDRFKEVNDTLGHHVGDALLQQIGPRLNTGRTYRPDLLCRLGGDEFALYMSGLADGDEALEAGQALLRRLQESFLVDGMNLQISGSIGIALHPRDGADSHALLRSADVAMYSAKRSGTGVMLYDRELDTHTPERLTMMADLTQGIREGQLRLFFQPQLHLQHKRITGFEALVRWQHPRLGLLTPDQFLPVAEVNEVIQPLTDEVLRLALEQQQAWKQRGHSFNVSVNLSVRNLADDRCVDVIGDLMQRYETGPGELEVEITETALMHDPESAGVRLERIAALGVTLAIDDFGTGFSSLSYLRRWPLSALKIDRLFVSNMLRSDQDAIIVRSTIALAHNLGLKVVAEGVEDQATQAALHRSGCDLIQGYHVSRPEPWDRLQRTLRIAAAA